MLTGWQCGWGTTLTNDIGFPNISIVVKAIMAGWDLENMISTVKQSDNKGKTMGDSYEVDRCERVFGAKANSYQECLV